MTGPTTTPLTVDRCVIRNTAARKGRTRTVSPTDTASRHLHYGRIILDAGAALEPFPTTAHETGFIALSGSATLDVDGQTFSLGQYDGLYVPRDSQIAVSAGDTGC